MRKATILTAAMAAMAEALQGNGFQDVVPHQPPNDKINPVLYSHKKKPGKFKPKQFKKRKGRSE